MVFKPGESGNPEGRPKNPAIEELRNALEKVQNGDGSTLLEHFVKRAYESDAVLIAVVKKLLPDLRTVEANILAGADETNVVYIIEKYLEVKKE